MVKAKEQKVKSWDKPVPDEAELILKMDQQKNPKCFLVLGHWSLESVCNRAMAEQVKRVSLAKHVTLDSRKFERGFAVKNKKFYSKTHSIHTKGAIAATFYFV